MKDLSYRNSKKSYYMQCGNLCRTWDLLICVLVQQLNNIWGQWTLFLWYCCLYSNTKCLVFPHFSLDRHCSKIVLKMSDLQTKVVKVAVIPPSPLMDISTMVDLFFKVLHSHEFLGVFIYIILFCKPSKTNLHQTQPAHLLKYTS